MRAFCSKEHRTRRGQVINTGPGSESTREETEEGGGAYALEEAEDEVDGLGHNPLHLGRRHGGGDGWRDGEWKTLAEGGSAREGFTVRRPSSSRVGTAEGKSASLSLQFSPRIRIFKF